MNIMKGELAKCQLHVAYHELFCLARAALKELLNKCHQRSASFSSIAFFQISCLQQVSAQFLRRNMKKLAFLKCLKSFQMFYQPLKKLYQCKEIHAASISNSPSGKQID